VAFARRPAYLEKHGFCPGTPVTPLATPAALPAPIVCGSLSRLASPLGRAMHEAGYRAMRALEEVRALRGARVLLVGAGGVARAIAFGLRDRGAVVTIANRDRAKAESLAAATGARGAGLDEAARAADYDVVVNATSVGQVDTPAESPVSPATLHEGQVVMDVVYKPLRTPLLDGAETRGATLVHGGRMLLHQAASQFELYTGAPAPLEAMDAALRAITG